MGNFRITANKKLSTLLTVVGFFVIFICFAPPAQAATSTVMGLGYWQGYGYVSFNCANDTIGDRLGVDHNFNIDNLVIPSGFHFYAPPCTSNQHGVYIDSNNNFSGKAWNNKQGFISFSGSEPPPGGYGGATQFNTHCEATCNASNDCWACYNETEQKVYGWAQVDVGGEWIRLDSKILNPALPPVKIQTSCSIPSPAPGIGQGDFYGYATDSSDNLLSFNCQSDNILGTCATRNNYSVYISNLTIGSMSAPNWDYEAACSNALGAKLTWCVRSGKQTAYEIVIAEYKGVDYVTMPGTSTAFCWSEKLLSTDAVNFYPQDHCPSMGYNQNYYWWIKLYDDNGSSTEWYQYYGNSASSTDKNIDGNPKTFTTYKNKFPVPYLTWSPGQPGIQWSPTVPEVGSTTKFTSEPYYYDSSNPSTPVLCTDSTCIYSWWSDTPEPLNPTIVASTSANTDIVFSQPTSTDVSLMVTVRPTVNNPDNYSCTWTQIISKINYGLPVWREIKAQ